MHNRDIIYNISQNSFTKNFKSRTNLKQYRENYINIILTEAFEPPLFIIKENFSEILQKKDGKI